MYVYNIHILCFGSFCKPFRPLLQRNSECHQCSKSSLVPLCSHHSSPRSLASSQQRSHTLDALHLRNDQHPIPHQTGRFQTEWDLGWWSDCRDSNAHGLMFSVGQGPCNFPTCLKHTVDLWLALVQDKISKCSSVCYTCNSPCFETSISQDRVSERNAQHGWNSNWNHGRANASAKCFGQASYGLRISSSRPDLLCASSSNRFAHLRQSPHRQGANYGGMRSAKCCFCTAFYTVQIRTVWGGEVWDS